MLVLSKTAFSLGLAGNCKQVSAQVGQNQGSPQTSSREAAESHDQYWACSVVVFFGLFCCFGFLCFCFWLFWFGLVFKSRLILLKKKGGGGGARNDDTVSLLS